MTVVTVPDLTTLDDAGLAAVLAGLDAEDEAERVRLSAPDVLLRAAVYYAREGHPVFPVKARGKAPTTPHGLKDATTDVERVTAWWKATPEANIGLPTGLAFDVIDIDGPAGFWSLADMQDAGAVPPLLGKSFTPSGGRHLFIEPTGDRNGARLLPGVDYRGLGGYVCVPPSVGANGRRYSWLQLLNAPRMAAVA